MRMAADMERLDFEQSLVSAALAAAAQTPWGRVSLGDIAAAYGADMPPQIRDKNDILPLLGGVLAAAAQENLGGASDEVSPKDRLFEFLMAHLDALQDRRDGMRSILAGMRRDPCILRHLLPSFLGAMGVGVGGGPGPTHILNTIGISIVYGRVLWVWMRDETPDLSPSMAALDRALDVYLRLAKNIS